jgi:hypothetical protein
MLRLSKTQVEDLIEFISDRLILNPCNHSHKNAIHWAELNSFNCNDLVDILEANGGFCDCEVVNNLPIDQDLILHNTFKTLSIKNSWKLPKSFEVKNPDKDYTKVLVATENCRNNCYAEINEVLIPAPFGAKPAKRIRKSVHFFVGVRTGLPNEYGFVNLIEPINSKNFAKLIRNTQIPELRRFTDKEAEFYLSKLDSLLPNTPVGSHFMERSGLTGKEEELRIHKIFIGK